jgi:ketosteroid isomerase-like protein
MRSWRRLGLALGALVLMLAAGIPSATAQVASKQTDEQAVRSLLDDQVEAWNRGDIPGFMKGYWNSENVEFVNTAGVFRGWQNVFDRYMKTYPDKSAMGQLTFSGLEIHVMCPSAAYAVGRWRLERQDGPIGGVFTLIFRKFADGWKIVNDHTSQFPAAKNNP